jgi:YD repeat-containing protein
MADGTGTTIDICESSGRITTEQNGADAAVGYGYDLMSHLTSTTYADGLVATYDYDTADRLTAVNELPRASAPTITVTEV